MGFNYSKERMKFERQIEENERRYRDAGMSETPIAAMREFEEELFRKERVYRIHIVLEYSMDIPGIANRTSTRDEYFQEVESSLDFILENLCPQYAAELTKRNKEVLVLLSLGFTQAEAAEKLGIAQQTVSRHMKKIKKIVEKGV